MYFIFTAKLLIISSIYTYEISGYAIPPAVQPVADLDLLKFSGRWYEVYSSLIPKLTFTKDWVCVTATYTVRDVQNGVLDLFYNGRLGTPFGAHYNITGTAIAEHDGTGVFAVKYNPHLREKNDFSSDEKVKLDISREQDLPSSNIPENTSATFADSMVSNITMVTESKRASESNVSINLSVMKQVTDTLIADNTTSTSNTTSPPYTETSASNSPSTTGSPSSTSNQLEIQSTSTGIKENVDTENVEDVASIDTRKESTSSSSLESIVTYAKVFVKNLKYVIVKLGPETFGASNQYEYAIITTPSKLSLGILTRDLRTFHDKYADEVFDFLRENEFVSIWNRPRPVHQESDCRYPMHDKGFSLYAESKQMLKQVTE